MNVKNTVYDLKRIIGRLYNDSQVKNDIVEWPFSISENNHYYPQIEVTLLKKSKSLIPEEIIGMILSKMKETAEETLKQPITDAVITVPTFFSSAQRKAIIDAGKIGGLNVVRLVNETTAAALAYAFENQIKVGWQFLFYMKKKINKLLFQGKQTIFVYHLGGGTFDVSIIKIMDGCRFFVLAVGGDSALGGIDFDSRLVAYFAEEIERNNKISIKKNARSMRRLRTACEKLKVVLSSNDEAFIEVDSLCEDLELYS
jgi:heat shock 70kDa protein 1/2/6/8